MIQSTPRRLILGAAVAAGLAGAVAVTLPALAQESMEHAGHMHGMGPMGGDHAMTRAHLERALDEVGATPAQKQRIGAVLHGAFADMGQMHEHMAATHADLHRILTAPVIDRAALERLRAERMAEFDQASRKLVNALADAAEVLSPAQRARLGAMMAEHRHAHP
jgi:Spy/CpxP family protein refolding chaperone